MNSTFYPLSVAPMMAWTDRHCRVFHRMLAPHALLYTEMVTAQALQHGNVPRHLEYNEIERPVVLQLGGSEPDHLSKAAALGEEYGYEAINLNCGCPSERVRKGAFGACLMREPDLVADCVSAMQAAVNIPVTVKHRIGLEREESDELVFKFVSRVAEAGCKTFVVHARNAWLSGLSPKENREVPPLRYDVVARLKISFPQLNFILNGGLSSTADAMAALDRHGAVMLGRLAYHEPYALAELEHALYGTALPSRASIVFAMTDYLQQHLCAGSGAEVRHVVRHMLGLFHGLPAARVWRRTLSDSSILAQGSSQILRHALAEMNAAAARSQDHSILPGFMRPSGSSAALI